MVSFRIGSSTRTKVVTLVLVDMMVSFGQAADVLQAEDITAQERYRAHVLVPYSGGLASATAANPMASSRAISTSRGGEAIAASKLPIELH